MNTKTMKGYKLFKELDDGTIHIVRITNIKELQAQNPAPPAPPPP